MSGYSQLVSLPPARIFNKFLFNLQYLFAHFKSPRLLFSILLFLKSSGVDILEKESVSQVRPALLEWGSLSLFMRKNIPAVKACAKLFTESSSMENQVHLR